MSIDSTSELPENHIELDKDGRVLSFINNRQSHYIVRRESIECSRENACDIVNATLAQLAAASPYLSEWYFAGGDTKENALQNPAFGVGGRTTIAPESLRPYRNYWNVDFWNEVRPGMYGELHFTLGESGPIAALSLILDRRVAEAIDEQRFTRAIVATLDPTEITVTRAGDPHDHTLYNRP